MLKKNTHKERKKERKKEKKVPSLLGVGGGRVLIS
jgi:hypothetical protein